MSPELITAVTRARSASFVYVVSWGVFVVVCVAGALAAVLFPALLSMEGRQAAAAQLAMIALVGVGLPAVGDAVLAWALTGLPEAAGQTRVHPVLRVLLVVAALTLPLLATAASVSTAARALPPTNKAAPIPDSGLTLWFPIVGFFVICVLAGVVSVGWSFMSSSQMVPTLLLSAAYPAVGLLRVALGLKLKSAFAERLLRPAVDADHARGIAPVAGG